MDHEQLAWIFEEWEGRYRANPEEFMSEAVKLLKHTPYSYGELAATYFELLWSELSQGDLP